MNIRKTRTLMPVWVKFGAKTINTGFDQLRGHTRKIWPDGCRRRKLISLAEEYICYAVNVN